MSVSIRWNPINWNHSDRAFIVLTSFLLTFALFSNFIRDRLHLAEPPLATLWGILTGPRCLHAIDPKHWFDVDDLSEELARIVVGLQVFNVGIELPNHWFGRNYKSLFMMLGPVMLCSYATTALLVYFVLGTTFETAFIIGACLAPTDPVLAASVLGNSHFSKRVPQHIKDLLGAESGANDGVSYPFLYLPALLLLKATAGQAVKEWILVTILYKCGLGLLVGGVIGLSSNRLLRYCLERELMRPEAFLSYSLLLALFSTGAGTMLGMDDFLCAFGAGIGFSFDGFFKKHTEQSHLPTVIDLVLNSSFFLYFGAIIPWHQFDDHGLTVVKLVVLLILILVLRRIPGMLLAYKWVPEIRSLREALFVGHMGPMGVGAIFLAASITRELGADFKETGKRHAMKEAIQLVNPVVSFVVFGSIMVHGLSVGFISFYGHLSRDVEDQADMPGAERGLLEGFSNSDYGSVNSLEA
ncbi:Na/H antiporter-like protein [Protomyces lactucae-debilis]|uniref:Na/H antiporter-like protein n=1 Tax=Protomyces lactucae-debilis TaxID=2754530 RepID=A0A1Y2F3S6_PROLT|nr:Na/H antiporter-like protein [Protomyces lactucae-debilis]ORY78560.1 Na/H antiporter-like protein [Protomyces lactucae-debilis]